MNKLYVDGCSLTYGAGLDRKYSVGSQLGAELDLSRPGKSNTAMVSDFYKHIDNYDTFVIGLTYPSRYTFYNDSVPIDLQPRKTTMDRLVEHPMGEFIENTYPQFYKVLWSLTNHREMKALSNFYVNSIISLLEKQNKKYLVYCWENLDCNNNNYFVPEVPRTREFLLEDGHFNEIGMELLANIIKEKLNAKE